jgi:hypothetical protein
LILDSVAIQKVELRFANLSLMPSMATGPVRQGHLALWIEPLRVQGEELFAGTRKAEGLHFGALGIVEGGEMGGRAEASCLAGETGSLLLLGGGTAVSTWLWSPSSL